MRMDTRRASTVPVAVLFFRKVGVTKLILKAFILTKTEGVITILTIIIIITKHADEILSNFLPVIYNCIKLRDWYLSL